MGGSASERVRVVQGRWTWWSHRLTLVCLAGSLVLALALVAPLNPLGYQIPTWWFLTAFCTALAVLALWIVTSAKGVDVWLPALKPPFAWLTSTLLFLTITLRYVLVAETGALAFLAFPSQWRYLALVLAAYGALGIVKGMAGAMAGRRNALRQLS